MTDPQAHTTRAHARLAPSAAHRWLHCPGSVRLSENIPDVTSSFAAEGTAAHELCAHCLSFGFEPSDFGGQYVDIEKGKIVETPLDTDDENRFFEIDDEMVEGVTMYVDHVLALAKGADDSDVEVEQKLDMTHLHPEIFGTGDATVFQAKERHLHVVDFKYGKGVAVDADDNPQLLLYAAGAARRHHNRQIEKLTMHIVQPRAPHPKGPVRSYEIDLLSLFEFEDDISAAAKATEAEDASTTPGEWCRFCKAQPICLAAREDKRKLAADEFGTVDVDAEMKLPLPENMQPAHIARVLKEADGLLNWCKSVQEFAHAQAMAGNMPEGFKLVAKRAIRKWVDEDTTKNALYDMGATNDDILTEPKLKSPAQLEKLFPGKNKDERQKAMAELVTKSSSGTNLVPTTDPRPAVHVGASADFEAVDAD